MPRVPKPPMPRQVKGIPTIIVLFGATGDLVQKKILPALYQLFRSGQLPKKFHIVGFSRRELSDAEFREYVHAVLRSHGERSVRKSFLASLSYQRGTFERPASYGALSRTLTDIDAAWGVCANKLFYLAVPPKYYSDIFGRLAHSGLTQRCSPKEGWTRVIVEKPFGSNLKTAQKLDRELGKLFREEQIYRIDHYLGKEMAENILTFRFANTLFGKSWSNALVERIDVRVLESSGVRERGRFYDRVGALQDVGQNHMLQMLALTTMEQPPFNSAAGIRKNRAAVLKALKRPTPAALKKNSYRAQYRGYRRVDGVRRGSTSETYFALRTELLTPTWRGVPIFLEHGKAMERNLKEIVVTFRHPVPCFCQSGTAHKNRIRFSLDPEERISIRFWAKKPGFTADVEERDFTFDFHGHESKGHVAEYAQLLHDCFAGDQRLFVSTEEVGAMWRFIDPIVCAWRENVVPLKRYRPGSKAPRKESAETIGAQQ